MPYAKAKDLTLPLAKWFKQTASNGTSMNKGTCEAQHKAPTTGFIYNLKLGSQNQAYLNKMCIFK